LTGKAVFISGDPGDIKNPNAAASGKFEQACEVSRENPAKVLKKFCERL
jgi:hypothetical protein